jgi:hypothetical protein
MSRSSTRENGSRMDASQWLQTVMAMMMPKPTYSMIDAAIIRSGASDVVVRVCSFTELDPRTQHRER